MKPLLETLSFETFASRLGGIAPMALDARQTEQLYSHYQELGKWNRRLSLIGPGTVGDVLQRHYAESLEGVKLMGEATGNLVDVGSGAGFPGFVLAVTRPETKAFLVESRQRKAAFLRSAARRARLQVECVAERLTPSLPSALPGEIHSITLRAVRLPASTWRALVERLAPGGRVLLWMGSDEPLEASGSGASSLEDLGLRRVACRDLEGSTRRRIVCLAAD